MQYEFSYTSQFRMVEKFIRDTTDSMCPVSPYPVHIPHITNVIKFLLQYIHECKANTIPTRLYIGISRQVYTLTNESGLFHQNSHFLSKPKIEVFKR